MSPEGEIKRERMTKRREAERETDEAEVSNIVTRLLVSRKEDPLSSSPLLPLPLSSLVYQEPLVES